MKRRALRAIIIIAVIAIAIALVITVGFLFSKHAAQRPTASSEPLPAGENARIPEGSTFSIHFFDVGEADSALVECDGHYMLIDGGGSERSSFLYAYLQQHQIDHLDYIVCSHAHSDHVGGLAGALNYATVDVAYAPVADYDSRAFRSFVKYLNAQEKEITVPAPGDSFQLGGATAVIVAPIDMALAEENGDAVDSRSVLSLKGLG